MIDAFLPDSGGKLARSESNVEWTTMLQQMKLFSANFSPEQVGHSPLACKLTSSSPSGCCRDLLFLCSLLSLSPIHRAPLPAPQGMSECLRSVIAAYTILVTCLLTPQTLDGISILKCAIEHYQPNPSSLTALHADLIQVSSVPFSPCVAGAMSPLSSLSFIFSL